MGFEFIRFEKKDGIATLTLNRPKQLNAINSQMIDEILEAIAEAGADGLEALDHFAGCRLRQNIQHLVSPGFCVVGSECPNPLVGELACQIGCQMVCRAGRQWAGCMDPPM